jgi:S-adenosyl methyltransferase
VYVDNDPVVMAHARALLTSRAGGLCDYVEADLRDTGTIFTQAAETLDFARPVAVLMLAVLHLVPDRDDPAMIVKTLASGLAPGSYLAISHMTADFAPQQVSAAVAAYNELAPAPVTPRTREQVTGLFGGLPLLEPGVVPVTGWRPASPLAHRKPCDLYAGVARIRQEVGPVNPAEHTAAVNALERLAAELDPGVFATTLVAGEGKVACLSVASRHAGLAEDVCARDGWFWWSWAERLAPVTEVSAAAAKVAAVLRLLPGPAAHGQ